MFEWDSFVKPSPSDLGMGLEIDQKDNWGNTLAGIGDAAIGLLEFGGRFVQAAEASGLYARDTEKPAVSHVPTVADTVVKDYTGLIIGIGAGVIALGVIGILVARR